MRTVVCSAIFAGCLVLAMGSVGTAVDLPVTQQAVPVTTTGGGALQGKVEQQSSAQRKAWITSIKPAAGPGAKLAPMGMEYWKHSVRRDRRPDSP